MSLSMSDSVKTILIADDDEDLRLLVQVTLENPTYRILTAVDGSKALDALNQQCRPDLLIIDWMMPGLNGYEVGDPTASESMHGRHHSGRHVDCERWIGSPGADGLPRTRRIFSQTL